MTTLNAFAELALHVLYSAIESPHGIIVRTNDTMRARQLLYKFRKDLNDPNLNLLKIRLSPHDTDHELWIIKSTVDPETKITTETVTIQNLGLDKEDE